MLEKSKLFGGGYILAHAKDNCAGWPCALHNPSNHPMATFRQSWRGDRGLMERICPHGVGHPDPDHMSWFRLCHTEEETWAEGVHGCCGFGCCHTSEEAM